MTSMGNIFEFDTLSLHAGQSPDSENGSRAVPIYQTTSYVFKGVDHAASMFNLERPGEDFSTSSSVLFELVSGDGKNRLRKSAAPTTVVINKNHIESLIPSIYN